MGKSTRKPYASVTGSLSAKQDKIRAHRSERRMQNQMLKKAFEDEDLLLPHKLECAFNDVWGWSRDGKQSWRGDWQFSDRPYLRDYYIKLLRK